jgi:hypothetical protein
VIIAAAAAKPMTVLRIAHPNRRSSGFWWTVNSKFAGCNGRFRLPIPRWEPDVQKERLLAAPLELSAKAVTTSEAIKRGHSLARRTAISEGAAGGRSTVSRSPFCFPE